MVRTRMPVYVYLLFLPHSDARMMLTLGRIDQVLLGTIFGAVMGTRQRTPSLGHDPNTRLLGFGFSHLMRISHQKGFVDRQSYVAQYIALVLLVMGIASTLGMDDLLAAFAAGTDPLPRLTSLERCDY